MMDEIAVALRYDGLKYPVALTINGEDVLHFRPSARNVACAEAVVDALRYAPPGALASVLFCASDVTEGNSAETVDLALLQVMLERYRSALEEIRKIITDKEGCLDYLDMLHRIDGVVARVCGSPVQKTSSADWTRCPWCHGSGSEPGTLMSDGCDMECRRCGGDGAILKYELYDTESSL